MNVLNWVDNRESRDESELERTADSPAPPDNEHAFSVIVSRFSEPVFRFLYRMLGSREDAEDLTQETFYALHRNQEKLREGADVTPYLFTIAHRKAISMIRWRMVRRCLLPLSTEHEHVIPSDAESPRGTMNGTQIERIVNQAVSELKPDNRAVLILRFFENLSYKDIARITKKPEGTVKSLLFRAEWELRKKLSRIEGVLER